MEKKPLYKSVKYNELTYKQYLERVAYLKKRNQYRHISVYNRSVFLARQAVLKNLYKEVKLMEEYKHISYQEWLENKDKNEINTLDKKELKKLYLKDEKEYIQTFTAKYMNKLQIIRKMKFFDYKDKENLINLLIFKANKWRRDEANRNSAIMKEKINKIIEKKKIKENKDAYFKEHSINMEHFKEINEMHQKALKGYYYGGNDSDLEGFEYDDTTGEPIEDEMSFDREEFYEESLQDLLDTYDLKTGKKKIEEKKKVIKELDDNELMLANEWYLFIREKKEKKIEQAEKRREAIKQMYLTQKMYKDKEEDINDSKP